MFIYLFKVGCFYRVLKISLLVIIVIWLTAPVEFSKMPTVYWIFNSIGNLQRIRKTKFIIINYNNFIISTASFTKIFSKHSITDLLEPTIHNQIDVLLIYNK